MLLGLVSVILLAAELVLANIYGTFPVDSSTLTAGRMNTLSWIDDKKWPSVKTMGPVKIDLYVEDTYVLTLAELIDPKALSTDVWISPSLGYNSSDYHIRFICEHPRTTVYTSDFTIMGMSNLLPFDGPTIDAHNESSVSIVYVTPKLTMVLPDATVVSTLKPIATTIEPTPPPFSSLDGSHLQSKSAAAAGLRKRPTVDLERLKFRFVFIFWPTLIGITMAL